MLTDRINFIVPAFQKLTSKFSVLNPKPPVQTVIQVLNTTKMQMKINTLATRKQPSSTIEAGSLENTGYIAQYRMSLRVLRTIFMKFPSWMVTI